MAYGYIICICSIITTEIFEILDFFYFECFCYSPSKISPHCSRISFCHPFFDGWAMQVFICFLASLTGFQQCMVWDTHYYLCISSFCCRKFTGLDFAFFFFFTLMVFVVSQAFMNFGKNNHTCTILKCKKSHSKCMPSFVHR